MVPCYCSVLLLLSLSYHRHQRMISEALELRVEGGRVSHGYGGLGVAGMKVVDGMHSGKSQGGWSHVGRCQSTFRVRGEDTDDTRSHLCSNVQLWVGLCQNWSVLLERLYHGTPWEGSGSLSMKPVGCAPWCSMDALLLLSMMFWVSTDACGWLSEAFDLHVEGGRINCSWWTCVVSRSYGGLGGDRDGGGGWLACGTQPGGLCRMSWDAGELPKCEVKTLMTPDHTAFHVHSSVYGWIAIDRCSREGFNTGCHKMAPVHCPWLHSMMLHGCAVIVVLYCCVLSLLLLPQAPEDDPQKR